MDTPSATPQDADPESPRAGFLDRHRARLFGIAYRMLGDAHEAEDLVQETYLRWHQLGAGGRAAVAAPEGWLVTATTRLALDRLRRAEVERLAYVGNWLPEPLVAAGDGAGAAPGPSPDRAAELASDLSVALVVLLERLAPEERAAFLLREVFDADYTEVARTLERSEPAVRQMVHRARMRVRAGRARFAVAPGAHARMVDRFLAALAADDQAALLALFAEDATLTNDSGGRVPAARNILVGPERIGRYLRGIERKACRLGPGRVAHAVELLNGLPGLVTRVDGRPAAATSFATDGERIVAVYRVLNPEKLRRFAPAPPPRPGAEPPRAAPS